MQVHHLNCGTFNPVSRKAFAGVGGLFERGEMVSHVILIEHDMGHVLIDSGIGQTDLHHPKGRLPGPLWRWINRPQLVPTEMAESQLVRLGLQPRDVRHIVLTHLDFDAVGGISDFPNATLHVWDAEYVRAMSPKSAIERARYSTNQLRNKRDWKFYKKAEDRWFGFECVRAIDPLAPEVLLVPLLGHSAGHCGVAINTDQGWLLHAGDAIMHRCELEANPQCPPALKWYENVLAENKRARKETVDRLRELHLKHGNEVRIVCGKDPVMFEQANVLTKPTAAYLR